MHTKGKKGLRLLSIDILANKIYFHKYLYGLIASTLAEKH